jgi:hypothetical protein
MSLQEIDPRPQKPAIGPQWILLMLVIGVMIITSIAFMRPISSGRPTPTPTGQALAYPVAEETEEALDAELTPTVMATEPPSEEEVGYTDGIILCSSVLVLILLVGTLRENLRRHNQQGGQDE